LLPENDFLIRIPLRMRAGLKNDVSVATNLDLSMRAALFGAATAETHIVVGNLSYGVRGWLAAEPPLVQDHGRKQGVRLRFRLEVTEPDGARRSLDMQAAADVVLDGERGVISSANLEGGPAHPPGQDGWRSWPRALRLQAPRGLSQLTLEVDDAWFPALGFH
jgi:hypothetical protein